MNLNTQEGAESIDSDNWSEITLNLIVALCVVGIVLFFAIAGATAAYYHFHQ